MADTPKIGLPTIASAQAQKHVTMNESLYRIDTLVQLSVLDKDLSDPPASPTEGDAYIVGASATGAWAGQENNVAAFTTGIWFFHVPRNGWVAWVSDENAQYLFDDGSWSQVAGGGGTDPNAVSKTVTAPQSITSPLGVGGATADTTNVFSVNGPAVLLNHGGDDMRVVLNKDAVDDTAAFIFQSDFSARAEFGLTGDDDFSFKTSPDGSAFETSFIIVSATGSAKFVKPPEFPQSSVVNLPTTATSAQVMYCFDATGGAGLVYYDGGGWKLVRDDSAP